jgi:hypothetical protein
MARRVKGTLFREYVQMIRNNKNIDWAKHLTPEELVYINQLIVASQWYPMQIYQRMGAAIFKEIARGNLESARLWGKVTMDNLVGLYKETLVVKGSPIETLAKFKIINQHFFDFEGFGVTVLDPNHVTIKIDRDFGTLAASAYCNQMLGSFQRLIELAGGREVRAEFTAKIWEGAPNTIVDIKWQS